MLLLGTILGGRMRPAGISPARRGARAALHTGTALPRRCGQRVSPGAAGTWCRGRRFRYNQSNRRATSPSAISSTRTSATWEAA